MMQAQQHRAVSTDHLGNVRATVSDMLIPGGSGVFDADLRTLADYYPFGMTMPGRSYEAAGVDGHRYGYNTQERVDEIAGEGNHYTAEFWEYDPRAARRWNLDPRPVTGISSFSVYEMNRIMYSDIYGDSIDLGNLYEKKSDGSLRYQAQVHAFELFASSEIGRQYILEHAEPGFVLRGEIIKDLNITVASEGAKSKAGIDASFMVDDLDEHARKHHNLSYMPGDAHTDEYVKSNGRLQMQYMLDKQVPYLLPPNVNDKQSASYKTLKALDAWLHEVFYHGELQERNYLRTGNVLAGTSHALYHQAKTTYRTSATKVLYSAARAMNLSLSKRDIFNHVQAPGFGIK